MPPPDWNEKNKIESLNCWIKTLNSEARRQFLALGTHIEIFFLFNDRGLNEVIPIVGMEKNKVVHALKKMLIRCNGYAFIHISEGTMHAPDNNEKSDVLIVQAESRDGVSTAWCSTVAKRGKEKRLLKAIHVDSDKLNGRFANIFQEIA